MQLGSSALDTMPPRRALSNHLLLAIALAAPVPFAVAEKLTPDQPEPLWYRVELLVFANVALGAEDENSELFYAHTLSYPLRLVRLTVLPRTAGEASGQAAPPRWGEDAFQERDEAVEQIAPASPVDDGSAAAAQWWEEDAAASRTPALSAAERAAAAAAAAAGDDAVGAAAGDGEDAGAAWGDGPIPYQVLPPSQWRLAEAHSRLNQDNSGYRVLFHEVWQQPVYSREEAQSVLIEGGLANIKSQEGELGGYLRLSASRHLHLDVDFWLWDDKRLRRGHKRKARVLSLVPVLPANLILGGSDEGWAPDGNGDGTLSRVLRQIHAASGQARPLLRMRQHRRMTPNSLHFLDHPGFGALVDISPLSMPEQ